MKNRASTETVDATIAVGPKSDGDNKYARYGSCRGPTDGLAEAHEGIKSALLPDWRKVDRHGVDCDVLSCRETVYEHANDH